MTLSDRDHAKLWIATPQLGRRNPTDAQRVFAYWWTGIAGDFTARPITETGVDRHFLIAGCAFATSLVVVLLAIWKLRESVSTERTR